MYQIIREQAGTGMKCGYCGTTFIPRYPNQKYCSKECSRNRHREQKCEYARRRYNQIRNKQIIDASAFRPGTGNLTQHRLTDEEAEYERIQRELQRLRLRG